MSSEKTLSTQKHFSFINTPRQQNQTFFNTVISLTFRFSINWINLVDQFNKLVSYWVTEIKSSDEIGIIFRKI